ncbi:MAG: hypothetical protein AB1792_04715 [Candidatus Zixiibacteriota bacterium]
MERREESTGLWFWLFLIIAIFVLYCLMMQRPYCRTLDGVRSDRATPCAWNQPDGRPAR